MRFLRIPPDIAAILGGLGDTSENPFYWRERRRDARRGEPYRGLLNAAMLLAMFFALAYGGLWLLLVVGAFPDDRVPAWLGGQDGGRAVFAVVAALHGLIVYCTARGVMNRALSADAGRGTLLQVLMTRVPAFEMLAKSTVYPFQLAALAALAGLPFYAFLVSLKSVGIQEVFVLTLLFGLLAVAVPVWRTPGFGEQSPEDVAQALRSQNRSAGCLATLLVFVGLPGSMIVGSILYGLHLWNPQAAARIPADVWPALSAFPITGAWVIVRVLCAPYTWFWLPLPLWTWILPVLFLYRLSALWTSSLWLSVSHPAQLFSLPGARQEREFRRQVRRIAAFGLVGAAWQPLLESGPAGRVIAIALLASLAAVFVADRLKKRRPRQAVVLAPPLRRVEAAPPSARASAPAPPVVPMAVAAKRPSDPGLLDFIVDGVGTIPAPVVMPQPAPQAVPPPYLAPMPAAAGMHGAPPSPPAPFPLPPARDWRSIPLSPAGRAVLRRLAARTDNPVALYGARRALPGALSSDHLAAGLACGLLGMLVAYGAPFVLLAFVLPWIFFPLLFHDPALGYNHPAFGFALLIAALAASTLFSPMLACANVTKSFRMERDRSTLGFLLMTPLSSRSIALGHMTGPAIPAFAFWAASAALGLAAALAVAAAGRPLAGIGAWALGFGSTLLYLALALVTGAWIGISEQKAHDMTIGIYLLPLSMCGLGMAAAFYFWLNHRWSYPACVAVFLAIVVLLFAYMWRSTVGELQKLRHGDVPFEGRIAAG